MNRQIVRGTVATAAAAAALFLSGTVNTTAFAMKDPPPAVTADLTTKTAPRLEQPSPSSTTLVRQMQAAATSAQKQPAGDPWL